MFKRSTIILCRALIYKCREKASVPSSVSNTWSWTKITGNLKTQCQKERDIALSPFITDIFVPLCDAEGMFVPLQCFEHDTYGKQCWCVDSSGQEIKGTRMDNGTAPECGECKQTSYFFNRPFYSCGLSYGLVYKYKQGLVWPCFDTDLSVFLM